MKSSVVDPWKRIHDDSTGDIEVSEVQASSLSFEDSFVKESDLSFSAESATARLPDSAEYLASLEKKLEKLKSKRKGKDIVKSLEEKHKSCMMNLLSDDNRVVDDDDFILDTPVNNNHPLMRYVAPDKQALTLGELVELLKADHLSQVLEQQLLGEEDVKIQD